jgi:molecular chaperone GrpE
MSNKQHEQDKNASASDAAAVESPSLETLREKLASTEQELAELKDKYLRSLAESENSRKRMRQQAEDNTRIQREALLRDFLTILDNLERAVAAAQTANNSGSIVQGIELVLNSMKDFLRGHGVNELSAVGQAFDPLLHEAVAHVESTEHGPNTVIDQFSRGYKVGDKVLRPARVAVAKAPNPQ